MPFAVRQVLTKMYTEQILRKHEMEAFEEVCDDKLNP